MALVRFDGGQVRCKLIGQDKNGDWLCRSLQHAPRLSMNTRFCVKAGDVIERDQPEVITSLRDVSPTFDAAAAQLESQGHLEAAMAAERETLPTVKQVMKDNPPIAHDAPGKIKET